METSKAVEFCGIFYNNMQYPVHLYRNGVTVAEFPKAPVDFVSQHLDDLRQNIDGRASVLITEENLIFGMIVRPEEGLEAVLGPISLVSKTRDFWHSLNARYALADELRPDADLYIRNLAGYSTVFFLNLLSLLNAYFNKDAAEPYAVLQEENSELKQKLNEIIAEETAARSPSEAYRAAYLYEQKLVTAIRNGDVEAMRHSFGIVPGMHIGKFGDTDVRRAKNLFICIAAVVNSTAMGIGMDLETAYTLSEYYLRRSEQMRAPSELTELTRTLLVDYATHCRDVILTSGLPREVFLARQYIRKNLNRQISVAEVAECTGLSASQLTRKMKGALGVAPGEYICRCKMEQARKYLKDTRRSITNISETLCFSSPSYFSTVFRQTYGQTPQEYRQSGGAQNLPFE